MNKNKDCCGSASGRHFVFTSCLLLWSSGGLQRHPWVVMPALLLSFFSLFFIFLPFLYSYFTTLIFSFSLYYSPFFTLTLLLSFFFHFIYFSYNIKINLILIFC